jgi:glycosyltransferase involved in cell wall biosynthesis
MIVSVIIPCFNVKEFIVECIDSVLNQTYSNLEILCIDNNSTDGTYERLQELEHEYAGRIKVFRELKKGASAARNKGLMEAKGEWIQFLDADDLLMPQKIEHQLKVIANCDSTVDFIVSASVKRKINGENVTSPTDEHDAFKAIFISKLGNTCSNLFRKSKLNEIAGWNEELKSSQETDLMFRLLMSDMKVVFDDVPLTIIRERVAGQISQQNTEGNWIQYIKLRGLMIEYLKGNKNSYFKAESDFFLQKFYIQLQKLLKFDKKEALELYKQHFDSNFVPHAHPIYVELYKLLGFEKTEKILRVISIFK